MKAVVVVQCLSVKLRLTLGDQLLSKTLQTAVVEPFLVAYNKRAAAPLTSQDLLRVEVDGTACDMSSTASELLTGEAPAVVLHAPTTDAFALADALAVLPAEASDNEALAALRALRRASHDEAAREAVLAPRVIVRAAEYAGLSAAAPRAWGAAGAEATVLLHNLLVLDRDGVGSALCAPPLCALPQLLVALEAAADMPPERLGYLGHLAFHLSLVAEATAGPRAASLLRACQAAPALTRQP